MAKKHFGTSKRDVLYGGDNVDDIFYGYEGDDHFYSSTGRDTYYGGDGIDTVSYYGAATGVVLNLHSGFGVAGEAQGDKYDSIENITGSLYSDTIWGSNGDNYIYTAHGNDWVYAGNGNDIVTGGFGDDYLFGGGHNDKLYGSYDDDYLHGGSGNDSLYGGNGDDRLYGSSDHDTLEGGRGADYIHGGSGNDTASYSRSYAGVTVDLQTGAASGGDAAGDTIRYVENVIGSSRGGDDLRGDGNDNTLNGQGGNDVFRATEGNDTIIGGTGFDTLDYSQIEVGSYGGNDGVRVDLGRSEVRKLDDNGSTRSIDDVSGVEHAIGTDLIDTFRGDSADNYFQGLDGDDRFFSDAGADLYDGGDGADAVYYLRSGAGVSVNLQTAQGSGGDAAGDGFAGIENVTGSIHDDTLTGDDGANGLRGGLGDDILRGGAGNDILAGESGADVIDGGEGFDTAVYMHEYVSVDLAAGTGGTVQGAPFTSEAEGDTLTGIEAVTTYGNIVEVLGDDGANQFNVLGIGGTFEGRGGDDQFNVDAVPREGAFFNDNPCTIDAVVDEGNSFDGGDGIDTVNFSNAYAGKVTRTDPGYDIDLQDGEAFDIEQGSDITHTLENIENVTGSNRSDIIRGDNAANVIDGNYGDDIIDGGGGNDVLFGGAGADVFEFRHQDFGEDDIVADFRVGTDRIDLSDTEVTNFNDLFSVNDGDFIEQVGLDVVIHSSDEDTITLQNTNLGDLNQVDFIF